MAKLLVIDLLDLDFDPRDRPVLPSTAAWFERALEGAPWLSTRIVSGGRDDLCRLAQFVDGVVLGGSARDAWRDDTFNDQLLDLVALCQHGDIPVLGICFGAQLLARSLGGETGPRPEAAEIGPTPIALTEAGRGHFLFRGLAGESFVAVQSHRDAIVTLPPGAELLAFSERAPIQAFALGDQFFGTQFHPEMTSEGLLDLARAWEGLGLEDRLGEVLGEAPPPSCPSLPLVLENFARRVGRPELGSGI